MALADRLRREDLAPEDKKDVAAALEAILQRRLGCEALARLDDGDQSVLEGVVSQRDRITLTEARRNLGRERSHEASEGNTRPSDRQRELDDDMEL